MVFSFHTKNDVVIDMRIAEIIKDQQIEVYYKLNKKRRKKRYRPRKLTFRDFDRMMKENNGVNENRC